MRWMLAQVRHAIRWFGFASLITLLVLGSLPLAATASSEPSWIAQMSYTTDPTARQTVADIAARDATFQHTAGVISLGYTNAATWVRVEVKSSDLPQLVLSIQPAFVDNVQLYSQDPITKAWHMQQKGDRFPFLARDRTELCSSFTIIPSKTAPTVHYVRVQTRGSSLFRITVLSEQANKDGELTSYFWTGLYMGLLVLLALSALTHYATSGDRFWLAGLAYYAATIATVLIIMGYVTKYVLPEYTAFMDIVVHEMFWIHTVAGMYTTFCLYRYYGAPLWSTWTLLLMFAVAPIAMVAVAFGYILIAMKINAILFVLQMAWGIVPVWHLRDNDKVLINMLRGTLVLSGVYFMVFISPFLGITQANVAHVYPAIPVSFFIAVSLHLILTRRSYLRNLAYQKEQSKAQQLEMSLAFEHQKRLESASFLSMLLHELKTPLASIRLAVIAVLREIAGSHPNANERMRTIETSISDINHVLERTLEADKLEQGGLHVQLAKTHVATVLKERMALMDQAERITLHMEPELEVQADAYLLGLMVSNLLNNAQAYSAPDTEIELHARREAALGTAHPGTSLRIAVKNLPGKSGYPDPEKLFQKYYRSPRAQFHTGTGLGLYWVQGVLTLMGGRCHYYLEAQKIVFELEVPC